MNKTPLISVLMPVYNAGKYLRQSIESILNQTITDFEFIIFDDASADDSQDIIKSYNDKRINLIKSSVNKGYLEHLNHGLEIAKGEYIARMDADDISLPNRFEEQLKYLQQNQKVDFVGSYVTVFTDENENVKIIKYPTLPGLIKWHAIIGTPLAHPTIMFKKACLKQLDHFYNEEYYPAEDYELWTRVLKKFNISNIAVPLLKYRSHEQQTSAVKATLQQKNAVAIKKKYITQLFKIKAAKKIDRIYLFFNMPSRLTSRQFYSTMVLITGKVLTVTGIDKKSILQHIYQTLKTKALKSVKKIKP